MKIEVTPHWTCRRAGGLFLGFRYHFPVSVQVSWTCDLGNKGDRLEMSSMSIGLLLATINVEFTRKTKP